MLYILIYPFVGLGYPRGLALRYPCVPNLIIMVIFELQILIIDILFFVSCRFGPYFVEPIVAGLKEDNKPFISAFDLIGAPVTTDDFVVGGTCTNNLYGMCESLYRPNMVSERAESGGLHSLSCCM